MTPAIRALVDQAQQVGASASRVLAEAPMPLRPHTARLCHQTIRLSKGILSAVQEWVLEESRQQETRHAS